MTRTLVLYLRGLGKVCLSNDYTYQYRPERNHSKNHHSLVKYSSKTRRKNMFYMFAVILFIIIFFASNQLLKSNGMKNRTEGVIYQAIVVEYGDTLWDIAKNSGLKIDTRELVMEIMKMNSLGNGSIHPGQTIYVPVSTTKIASK